MLSHLSDGSEKQLELVLIMLAVVVTLTLLLTKHVMPRERGSKLLVSSTFSID